MTIKKDRGHTMPENMGASSTSWYFCDGAQSEGGTNTAHLILCHKIQRSKCGGDWWAPHNKVHTYQGWCWLSLAKKKDRKNIDKSVKKGKGGKTEKREKQE